MDTWWELLDNNWDELGVLIKTYHPVFSRKDRQDGLISAERSEVVCDEFRKEIVQNYNILPDLEKIKSEKDMHKLMQILNETWIGIPESRETVRGIGPVFDVLCDLCGGINE